MKSRGLRVSEPVVWAVLLVAALGFAYQTWTRDPTAAAQRPTGTAMWEERSGAVTGVEFQGDGRSTRLARRGEGDEAYFWGTMVRSRPTYVEVAPDSMELTEVVDTTVFVVNDVGTDLIASLASPRAARDLGVLDAERLRTFELDEESRTTRLTIAFGDRTRELRIGPNVFGGRDRYVLETASGRGYVVAGDLLDPFAESDARLAERRLHAFPRTDVDRVTVRSAAGRERVMSRLPGAGIGEARWAPPDAPDRTDQTFANFMERLGQLWVREYAADVELAGAAAIVRVEYLDAAGRALGFLDLFRVPGDEGQPEYLLRTELTRYPVRTYDALAEEVAGDVAQLF